MTEVSSNPAEWAGYKAPRGYKLGWKVVRPDGRTYNDFQWPLTPKLVVSENSTKGGPCPSHLGDGLCIAKTWYGAASGGFTAITGLALAYKTEHILGEGENKTRVSQCKVLGVLDLQRLINQHAAGADLYGADLRGANLRGANLSGANLSYANLSGANLYGAINVPSYVKTS